MNTERILKKSFIPLIFGAIAVASYFQALGITYLVASAWDKSPFPMMWPKRRPPPLRLATDTTPHESTAAAILQRNAFDSVTGPLHDGPEPLPRLAATNVRCESTYAQLIVLSEDDTWSFTALRQQGQTSVLRRSGDRFANYSISAIMWDRVWLTMGNTHCYAELFTGPEHTTTVEKSVSSSPHSVRNARGTLPPDIAARIRKVGENHYEIEQTAFDTIVQNYPQFMGRLRLAPEKQGDRFTGVRMMGVNPGSPVSAIGIENGDRLQSINGIQLDDPRNVMELYARLQKEKHFLLTLMRNGQVVNLDLTIK